MLNHGAAEPPANSELLTAESSFVRVGCPARSETQATAIPAIQGVNHGIATNAAQLRRPNRRVTPTSWQASPAASRSPSRSRGHTTSADHLGVGGSGILSSRRFTCCAPPTRNSNRRSLDDRPPMSVQPGSGMCRIIEVSWRKWRIAVSWRRMAVAACRRQSSWLGLRPRRRPVDRYTATGTLRPVHCDRYIATGTLRPAVG